MTNRKSHTPFRLVPKSVTLDDLERPIRILFHKRCVFRSPPQKLNEDRPILSAAKMKVIESSFWRHNICVNIRRGSLERGRQKRGGIENVDFHGCYVFGTLGNEANINTQYYLVPCRLSSDPKIYDLE